MNETKPLPPPRYPNIKFRPEGIKALLWTKEKILAEPRAFDMANWIMRGEHRAFYSPEQREYNVPADLQPPCGTAACLYGWIALSTAESKGYNGSNTSYTEILRTARFILYRADPLADSTYGISWEVKRFEDTIVQYEEWPDDFRIRYKRYPQNLEDIKENAQVAAEYIDYLIEHHSPDVNSTT
jgi:hypothetical protein